MKIEKRTTLPKIEVYSIIDKNVDKLIEEHKDRIEILEKSWNSSRDRINLTVKYKSDKLEGSLQILNHVVKLEGKIPFKYKLVSSLIKSSIESKLSEILDKAK